LPDNKAKVISRTTLNLLPVFVVDLLLLILLLLILLLLLLLPLLLLLLSSSSLIPLLSLKNANRFSEMNYKKLLFDFSPEANGVGYPRDSRRQPQAAGPAGGHP
jgi:hypothetical protein